VGQILPRERHGDIVGKGRGLQVIAMVERRGTGASNEGIGRACKIEN